MVIKPVLLLYSVLLFEICGACPSSCICKWKNGKQTVECINKDLLVIPEGMDSGTQVLEFSGNNLRTVHKEKFLKMDLINLQRIYLCRCRISSIDDRAFKGLTNLVELDLSANLLETVPTDTFSDIPSLMRLTLSGNPIKTLKKSAFNDLPFLNTIELNNCEILRVDECAFQGLHSLEWLHLKSNRLTTLNGSRLLPESLRGIELQGNLWECDCHMLEMRAWLQDFTISQSTEPSCKRPTKLAGRTIKSIPVMELACLPDVSPTTFYLEIGEGKNVSLLCHVHAIPEAHVSWWFQGQLLQNDSLVAPGVRLIYYIEDGAPQKRSELFIYNTNSADNGTFICSAENSAGIVYSNFTIRVVLKEEPHYDAAAIPFEFILITMTAASVSLLILILILILSILKCHRNTRLRHRKGNNKLHNTKDSLIQESAEEYSNPSKDSSNATLVDRRQMMFYSTYANEEMSPAMPPIATAIQVRSPTSLRRYQLEQNPDLINDTESVGRRKEGDGESHTKFEETVENFKLSSKLLPRTLVAERDLYRLSADVHLNPVGLLNSSDSRNCYRTLPYNRAGKRQSAANPINRFSREAEFLSQAVQQHAAYEHYCSDVRYTADGYPVRPLEQETTFSDGSVHSCCSLPPIQWPSCAPTAAVHVNPNPEAGGSKNVSKKCVGAQTQTDSDDTKITIQKPLNKSLCNIAETSDILTESPDEGYEGESTEN